MPVCSLRYLIILLSCVCRNLGVHISKIRSITLDEWEHETQMVRGEKKFQLILACKITVHALLMYYIREQKEA